MVLPAYAGMIPPRSAPSPEPRSAPRVCGDDPVWGVIGQIASSVLPAYAGMILVETMTMSVRSSAPRVCGDDPLSRRGTFSSSVCSPRMRG